jgi:HAD superfamily hydrolase (TIGR01509 family)
MILPGPASPGWAVLWDMDGTLVDTEPYWIAAEFDVVEAAGGAWSMEHAHALVGCDLLEGGAYIREYGGIDLEPVEIVERLLDGVIARIQTAIPWRPGARELLADLNAAGVPCALVTMSWRRFADPVLAALPAGSFAASITGDEVPIGQGKPHPQPYQLGAAAVGLAPGRCVAIEDSPTGARSALGAGCAAVIGVPNVADLDGIDGMLLRETLVGLTVADLARLVDPATVELSA